ncbi:DUF3868 domain-containing protein [Bacteroides thetaiotaomicron]|nr:DUF3868 domain-containing protein [Bacteroides thetaiotaomicron]
MKLGGVFIIAVIASLSLQAQTTVEEANGTIRATASSLHKAGEELVVSISVEITRDLSSNESLVLVPVVTDSLENRLELPSIYINSRKQQIIFMREMGKKEKDARSLQRKKRKQAKHTLSAIRSFREVDESCYTLPDREKLWLWHRRRRSLHLYRPPASATDTCPTTRISHPTSGGAENQN